MKKSNRGSSLVSLLVAISIFTIIVVMVTQILRDSSSQMMALGRNVDARTLANTIISQMHNSYSSFPMVKDSTGAPLYYVACFDESGSMVENKINSQRDYLLILRGVGPLDAFALSGANEVCDSVFEVHVAPSATTDSYSGAIVVRPQNSIANVTFEVLRDRIY